MNEIIVFGFGFLSLFFVALTTLDLGTANQNIDVGVKFHAVNPITTSQLPRAIASKVMYID